MTISDSISPSTIINIALKKTITIKELLFLYIIAIGDETTYLQLVTKGLIVSKILDSYVKNGYTINTSLISLPIITKKTIELFSDINFKKNRTNITTLINIPSIKKELERDSPEKWIDEYRNLFKGKKVGAMGDKNLCIARMTEFIVENPQFTKEHILKATQHYISDKSSSNYLYLRKAHYFISKVEIINGKKTEISDLRTYCEELTIDTISNLTNNDNQWFGGLKIG